MIKEITIDAPNNDDKFISSKALNSNNKREKITEQFKEFIEFTSKYSNAPVDSDDNAQEATSALVKSLGKDVYDFFNNHVDLNSSSSLVLSKNENLTSYSALTNIKNIVVLEKMNNFRKINKHFEAINEQLPTGSYLLGSFETFSARMSRNKLNNVPVIGKLNSSYEFVFKRVMPKLPYFKNLYFSVTKGQDRLLSKAEALGRLVSCGFDIIDVKEIDGIYYYVTKKVKQPTYDMNPSYGPLFKMKRVGKGGKIIGVYKFRTMHPYSEYLQDYVVKMNGYSETGKPADDFRVVPWAKVLRKYWLDELPQLINVVKGELKLVGVRPVSKSYFNTIPKDIQELRLTQKPGCIPPYVV